MYKNGLFLKAGTVEKLIPYPDPDSDQSQNLYDSSFLVEILSFHEIWLKSINNVLRHLGESHTQTYRQTNKQTAYITVPPQLRSQR